MWETLVQSLGWEKSPEEGKGYALQYSYLENLWQQKSLFCFLVGWFIANPQFVEVFDMIYPLSKYFWMSRYGWNTGVLNPLNLVKKKKKQSIKDQLEQWEEKASHTSNG